MKHALLISYLLKRGCVFVREGANHSIYFNPLARRSSSVPRHSDVHSFLAKKICRDLGISPPPNKGK